MKTILVTGGAGFIGSHVCDRLLAMGFNVVCVDNFNDYYPPEIKRKNISHNLSKKEFALVKADIADYCAMEDIFRMQIDSVIHLAARAGVRPSLENPFIYEETNIRGTLNLLELSRKNKVASFIFGSSSSVYGLKNKTPFTEDDRTDAPISPYAATKKAGEVLCYTYSKIYGLKCICLRFFTVYGPRGRPDMAPYLFTKAIDAGEEIFLFGDGSTRRDYTYIEDITEGIIACLGKDYTYEIFNLGNSRTVSLGELVTTIEQKLGKKAKIVRKPIPPGDVLVTYADISKATRLLGYSPKTSITKGISNFVDWYHGKH
ncbi:MAG: SDR family NAD(P)-dependent oxidoreductase [Nanoarchaeota archaeon]|nr:SDR family NAD(P)-dependent oxidoreductase [Nanoarchaeota archaeon]